MDFPARSTSGIASFIVCGVPGTLLATSVAFHIVWTAPVTRGTGTAHSSGVLTCLAALLRFSRVFFLIQLMVQAFDLRKDFSSGQKQEKVPYLKTVSGIRKSVMFNQMLSCETLLNPASHIDANIACRIIGKLYDWILPPEVRF